MTKNLALPASAPIANRWNDVLRIDGHFPAEHSDFIARCHAAGQRKPTPLLLQYHPDLGAGQARRRARKVVGVKPSRKLLVKPRNAGLKEGLETAAVAAAGGAALKAVSKLGQKVSARLKTAEQNAEEKEPALASQQS